MDAARGRLAVGIVALIAFGACSAAAPTPSPHDGRYVGSFSGSLDPQDLARKGIVELTVSGGVVEGAFTTGLGRRIAFRGSFGGQLGLGLGVTPDEGSGCTSISGTYLDTAFPGPPPRGGFTGALACREFTARWSAERAGAVVPLGTPRTGAFTFSVPEELPAARVGESYHHAFCDPAPSSELLCGGFVAQPVNPAGGSAPYTFQLEVFGRLPPGLSLGINGVLEGEVARGADERFEFSVCAVDATRSFVCQRTTLRVRAAAAASPTPAQAASTPTPARTPLATAAPTPTRVPTPTPAPQVVALNYSGTFTMTVTNGDWADVGADAQKADATTRITFQLTLARRSAGGAFTGSTRVTTTWTGTWGAKRITGFSDCPPAPGVSGTLSGSATTIVQGTVDPAKADEVKVWVDFPTGATETLAGFPKNCEPWLSSTVNMLWSAFSDCAGKAACTVFRSAGSAVTSAAAGTQLGFIARQYLTSKGAYVLSAQLTLVSETRR